MIFKTKKSSVIILAIVCLVTVSIILGGGIFFYISKKKNSVKDNIPPIIKQMITLNEEIKKTTIDIYKISGKLAGISAAHSRIGDIGSAIELIGSLRLLVEDNQSAIDRLLEFIEDHTDFVHRKNLLWVFAIKKFYMDHNVMQHHKSREKYLSAFEIYLKYTFTNFQNIMELQSPQYMQSYHTYYMRYRRAADSHNRFNKKRISFQTAFIEKNPEARPFLPGAHHLGEFKFWDKFSF